MLLVLNGIFMAAIMPVSHYFQSGDFSSFLLSSAISGNLGFVMWYFTRNKDRQIGKREGYLIVALGWILMSLFGCLPYYFSGALPSFTSAIFETVSGYTTTGASTFVDIEAQPEGILLWRSLTQWMGGMGIIVLTVAILPLLGVGGMQLFLAESPGPSASKIHPRITETAKRLWGIYVGLTVVETVALKVAGMTWYEAVNHAFTTMSTGGFSTRNGSIAEFGPTIQYIITFFMFLGGVNFSIIYFLINGAIRRAWGNEEFRFYLFTVLLASSIIAFVLIQNDPGYPHFEETYRTVLFQVISILTTTGFATANYAEWVPLGYIIIFLLMFFGGSAGSTAGGVKMVRIIVVLKNGFMEFKRIIHPRAIIPIRYNGRAVDSKVTHNILGFFLIYILIFVAGAVGIAAGGYDLLTAAGASIACLGNIGPGIGGVDPSHNFAFFSEASKMFLAFLMLLGRLELFTILFLFSPSFWKNR
jgi:trk system potassium uptake protein TrkH